MSEIFTFGSLCAGIGGIDLGLERAGMVCRWQVEKDKWCQRVLAKHWPNVPRFGDIRDVGKHNLEAVNAIVGGIPCQPFSDAGKRLGAADDRFLWPEMLRIVQEQQPRWVVVENVSGFIGLFLDQALADLEAQGYEAWSVVLPAIAFDAPHIRQRVFIVAHADGNGRYRQAAGHASLDQEWHNPPYEPRGQTELYEAVSSGQALAHAYSDEQYRRISDVQMGRIRSKKETKANGYLRRNEWGTEPGIRRVADGVPNRLDRLRGLGNAVVPQVAEHIGRLILQVESEFNRRTPNTAQPGGHKTNTIGLKRSSTPAAT